MNAEVVNAAEQRTDETRGLGGPPHMAHPVMPAEHHFLSDIIHQYRAHLDRRVQRGIARKGLQHRVQFLRPRRDSAASGPGVKCGGAGRSDDQASPYKLLAAILGLLVLLAGLFASVLLKR